MTGAREWPAASCAALLCVTVLLAQSCVPASPTSGPSGPETSRPLVVPSAAVATSTAPTTPIAPTLPAIASGTVTIEMGDHFFNPAQITVALGTTVVWIDHGQSAHDVTALDGSFMSSTMGPGNTFVYTFRKAGRYPYICTPHAGDGMVGEVDVQ